MCSGCMANANYFLLDGNTTYPPKYSINFSSKWYKCFPIYMKFEIKVAFLAFLLNAFLKT